MNVSLELKKFKEAHKDYYKQAKREVRQGLKQTCWIWFIFPQLKGLGFSTISSYYGLRNIEEAQDFYEDRYLRHNLIEMFRIVLKMKNKEDFIYCFGETDGKKVRSCATLFYLATKKSIFKRFLDKFFNGLLDEKTVLLLKKR